MMMKNNSPSSSSGGGAEELLMTAAASFCTLNHDHSDALQTALLVCGNESNQSISFKQLRLASLCTAGRLTELLRQRSGVSGSPVCVAIATATDFESGEDQVLLQVAVGLCSQPDVFFVPVDVVRWPPLRCSQVSSFPFCFECMHFSPPPPPFLTMHSLI